MLRRLARDALIATLLCALLASCSSALLYNRLDFILPWYVNDYARLDSDQEKLLDDLLAPFLDWHRQQELPCYDLLLHSVQASLDNDITPATVAGIAAEFEQAWYRVEQAALDWLLPLGERLTEQQVADFLAELNERQREYEEEYLARSDREFYEDSYDNLLDSAEDFLGRLSNAQRAQLRETSAGLLRSDRVWLSERAAFLARLAELMRREAGWQQRLRELVTAPRSQTLSADYRRVFEHNAERIYELVAQLLNGRSQQQDAHLRRQLAELRTDLAALAAEAQCARPEP